MPLKQRLKRLIKCHLTGSNCIFPSFVFQDPEKGIGGAFRSMDTRGRSIGGPSRILNGSSTSAGAPLLNGSTPSSGVAASRRIATNHHSDENDAGDEDDLEGTNLRLRRRDEEDDADAGGDESSPSESQQQESSSRRRLLSPDDNNDSSEGGVSGEADRDRLYRLRRQQHRQQRMARRDSLLDGNGTASALPPQTGNGK